VLDALFAGIAASVSQAMGGPYHSAVVRTSTPPVLDDGGSIVTPGQPVERACQCQVDTATDAMRADAGFIQGDMRLLILELDGVLGTDATVAVTAGPGQASYSVQAVTRDAAGIGWEARGRRV
jgi:hypothetical protein